MTPKERMRRAMSLERSDRVPVMCQLSIGHMLLQTGFSPVEFWFSAEVFTEGLLRMRQVYSFDGILISLHGHSPDWSESVLRVTNDEQGQTVFWKNGDRTFFPADDLPLHFPHKQRQPPSISEFDPESVPDEVDFIPVSQGLEFRLDPAHLYDIFSMVAGKAGDTYSIHGEVTSPFDYYLNLFGFKEAMMNLVEEASKSKDILQRFTDGVIKLALGMAKQGVDAVKISSPYAGSGFISPRFYREFVLPFESQIARALRGRGVAVYTHTCGAINDRLELMAETGVSGVECLDPPPLGDISLSEAKSRIGRKVFIKGNIDPIHGLLFGTQKSIKKDAIERIEVGKPGGGYILSTACSVAPRTRRENIQILVEAVEEVGYY